MGFSEMDEAKTKRIDTMCVSGVLLTGKLRERGIWPGMRGSQKECTIKDKTRGAQDFRSKESVTEQDHWGQ